MHLESMPEENVVLLTKYFLYSYIPDGLEQDLAYLFSFGFSEDMEYFH